jgi:hypothetical protein
MEPFTSSEAIDLRLAQALQVRIRWGVGQRIIVSELFYQKEKGVRSGFA